MAEFMYADRIPAEILAWGNELAQIRRDIHQHPELGFDTSRTCGVIATKLSDGVLNLMTSSSKAV